MAEEGHAPTFSVRGARELYLLGQGKCPECQSKLQPAGNSSYSCLGCDRTYPVGSVP